tara:strand:- start:2663 stop:3187 length:525 start_codon:yes stop_codon:yes gene_type:complete
MTEEKSGEQTIHDSDNFNENSNFSKAKFSALNMLNFRPRSKKEITDKLIQKGWSNTIVNKVVLQLEKDQIINDENFANLYAHFKVKNSFLGPKALQKELYIKGINNETIKKTIGLTYKQYPIDSLINTLLKKKGFKSREKISKKDFDRANRMLLRKGFSWDDINIITNQLRIDI